MTAGHGSPWGRGAARNRSGWQFCMVLTALTLGAGAQTVVAGGGSGNATALQGKPVAATAPASGNCLVFTTNWAPGSCSGTASTNWSALVSGTNSTGIFVLGSGASLNPSGTGVNNANQINGGTVPASAVVLGSNAGNQPVAAATTGAGHVVLATAPTLVTPALGTPSTINLSNATSASLPVGAINAGGTASSATYLRGDGIWSTPSGGSGALPVVVPETYGAKGDGAFYFDGSITSAGTATGSQTGITASASTPSITTTVNNSIALYVFDTFAAWSVAPSTGSSRVAQPFTSGDYLLTINDQAVPTAGVLGSISGTQASASKWNAAAIAFPPSGSISYIGENNVQQASGNATVTTPAGVASGDTLVGCVAYYATGNALTWPSGWGVLFTQNDGNGDALTCGVLTLAGSPPANYTWDQTQPYGISVSVLGYSGVLASGTTTLTSATANFTSADVGDAICTAGTNGSGGQQCGTISVYNSASSVNLSFSSAAASNVWFGFGTDDSSAFAAMLTSAPCSTSGCRVQFGPHMYMLTSGLTLPPNRSIQFLGAGLGNVNTENDYINGNSPINVNTGTRLDFASTTLGGAAMTLGGTAGVTNTAGFDLLSDLSVIGGAGNARDGGGGNGVAITNWQGAELERVAVDNFAGDGIYIDGLTASSFQDYIEQILLKGSYFFWNGAAGVKVGSSLGVADLETVSIEDSVSESNGGPALWLAAANIQGFSARNNVFQWDNTSSAEAELRLDHPCSGCVLEANYVEVDSIGGSRSNHWATPNQTGFTVINNHILGTDSGQTGQVGINTTTTTAAATVRGAVVAPPDSVAYSSTPSLDLSGGTILQFSCTTAGAAISPTLSNLAPGEVFTVIFVQNGSTACTWAWPASVHGGGTVTTALSGISAQQFVVSNNGTDAYAVSSMQNTAGGTP